jgi:hypothetical protein
MRVHLDEDDGMVFPVHEGGIKSVIGRSRHGHTFFPRVPNLFPTMRVVV